MKLHIDSIKLVGSKSPSPYRQELRTGNSLFANTVALLCPAFLDFHGGCDNVALKRAEQLGKGNKTFATYSLALFTSKATMPIPVDVIKRIGELYRGDFEMFGYEYLGPIKQLLNERN